MNTEPQIRIEAIVTEGERPALVAAAEQLVEVLQAASQTPWTVRLDFHPSLDALAPGDAPRCVVVSLLPEVECDEPFAATEARLRERFGSPPDDASAIFLCTVFRHVPGRAANVVERIRRLNLLAAEISADTGVWVVDLDRVFAEIGAKPMQTDYRAGGAIAAEVAGHTILTALLAAGLDDVVPDDVRERAQRFAGPWWEVGKTVDRRLAKNGARAR